MTDRPSPLVALDYVVAQGYTLDQMRDHLRKSPDGLALFRKGDSVLIWVNEGDLYLQRMNAEIYNMNLALGTHNNPDEGI
jgi:hypothetical protein